MRKLVWCGAACVVAAAVAVYVAADYAAKHPDSYLGRCAAAAAYVGARSNPFTLAGSMMGQQGIQAVAKAGAGAVCGALEGDGQAEMAEIQKPAEACEPEERVEMREPEEAAEPVEPIRPEVMPQEPFPCEREDRHEGLADGGLPFEIVPNPPAETEEPMPGTEHCERVPGCRTPDAETPEHIAPPAIQEDDTEETACVEVEMIPAPMCCESRCCEGGLCCWLYRLIKESCAPAAEEACEAIEAPLPEVEMLPMPAECGDDEPQEGTTEESTPPPMTECPQTDYHHYHHNSCPYMGGCPYPYSRCPVSPVPTPEKPRKKKDRQSKKPGSAEWLWKVLLGFDTEMPISMGIETLEFRPTDDVHSNWTDIPY